MAVGVVAGVASVDFSVADFSVVDFPAVDALLAAGVVEVLTAGAVDEADVFFTVDEALEYFFFAGAGAGGVAAGWSSQKENVPPMLLSGD